MTTISKSRGAGKALIGPATLCYVHVLEKYIPEGETDGKYQITVLIDKKDETSIAVLKEAINDAIANGIAKKWGGQQPKKLDLPIRDGDEKEDGDELFKGKFYFKAKSTRKPKVVDRHLAEILDADEIYSGMIGVVDIAAFPYAASGNKGVGFALNTIMKTGNGVRISGGESVETVFGGVDLSALPPEEKPAQAANPFDMI